MVKAIVRKDASLAWMLLSSGVNHDTRVGPWAAAYLTSVWNSELCGAGLLPRSTNPAVAAPVGGAVPYVLCHHQQERLRPTLLHLSILFNAVPIIAMLVMLGVRALLLLSRCLSVSHCALIRRMRSWRHGSAMCNGMTSHSNWKRLSTRNRSTQCSMRFASTRCVRSSAVVRSCVLTREHAQEVGARGVHRFIESLYSKKVANWRAVCEHYTTVIDGVLKEDYSDPLPAPELRCGSGSGVPSQATLARRQSVVQSVGAAESERTEPEEASLATADGQRVRAGSAATLRPNTEPVSLTATALTGVSLEDNDGGRDIPVDTEEWGDEDAMGGVSATRRVTSGRNSANRRVARKNKYALPALDLTDLQRRYVHLQWRQHGMIRALTAPTESLVALFSPVDYRPLHTRTGSSRPGVMGRRSYFLSSKTAVVSERIAAMEPWWEEQDKARRESVLVYDVKDGCHRRIKPIPPPDIEVKTEFVETVRQKIMNRY